MIVYTCPKCGGDLQTSVLTCIPPIHKYKCMKCGWTHEAKEEVVRVPFEVSEAEPAILRQSTYTYTASNFINDVCRSCSNHPENGGSGVCHCILGGSTTW